MKLLDGLKMSIMNFKEVLNSRILSYEITFKTDKGSYTVRQHEFEDDNGPDRTQEQARFIINYLLKSNREDLIEELEKYWEKELD